MFYVKGADPIALAMLPIALLLFWRHRENIRQLVSGRERTIGVAVSRARRRDRVTATQFRQHHRGRTPKPAAPPWPRVQ